MIIIGFKGGDWAPGYNGALEPQVLEFLMCTTNNNNNHNNSNNI